MKILITGANGFLGTYISQELLKAHDVVGLDRGEGDLRDPALICHHLERHRPDYVIHLAARVGRLFGEDNPINTIVDNAGMTANVAKACGNSGVRVAYASTSEVYGDLGEETVCESAMRADILPHNLYGLSKRWGEEVLKLYVPKGLVLFRFSMPIGPGHPPGIGRAALTNFIWNAMKRKPILVHKNSERSWCWVGDTARAVRMVMGAAWVDERHCGAWNVGRDDNKFTMEEIAVKVCEMVGVSKSLIQLVDAPARQTVIKRLSAERLRNLGWAPGVDLDGILRRTYGWLLENEERFDKAQR